MNPMKFKVTPYHHNLLMDHERLSAFYEAIKRYANGLVYDIGAGSGVLSSFAAPKSDRVIAIEKDKRIARYAAKNLSCFPNVEVVNEDVLKYDFPGAADTLICEMLDTALIDEEQVPVLRRALKFLKASGIVIPAEVINAVEPVMLKSESIAYDEFNTPIDRRGPLKVYSTINFSETIRERFSETIKLKAYGTFNAIRITSFVLMAPDIICGPTPMMNPPLLIPTGTVELEGKSEVDIKLSYTMGGGLDSIEAYFKGIS